MNLTYDVLNLILGLATDAGVHIEPDDLYDTSREAGTRTTPSRDYSDITVWAAAACDLVIREYDLGPAYRSRGITPYETAYRLRMCAYIASKMLPSSLVDVFDRYTLTVDDDGHAPTAEHVDHVLRYAVEALRDYVADRDQSAWLDPNVLAGAVADVHDAARLVIAAHEINGTDETVCRCDEDNQ